MSILTAEKSKFVLRLLTALTTLAALSASAVHAAPAADTPERRSGDGLERVLAPLRKLAQQVGSRPAIESAPLREQGIVLSREQVYRLVTKAPERLNVEVLAALCRIFGCQPNDLITVVARPAAAKKTGTGRGRDTAIGDLRPVRARLHRPADPGR